MWLQRGTPHWNLGSSLELPNRVLSWSRPEVVVSLTKTCRVLQLQLHSIWTQLNQKLNLHSTHPLPILTIKDHFSRISTLIPPREWWWEAPDVVLMAGVESHQIKETFHPKDDMISPGRLQPSRSVWVFSRRQLQIKSS